MFWIVESQDLKSIVWRYIIAVFDADLNYHGSADDFTSCHVVDVAKDMLSLIRGPLVEEDVYVDIRRYPYCAECLYVSNMCTILAEQLAS